MGGTPSFVDVATMYDNGAVRRLSTVSSSFHYQGVEIVDVATMYDNGAVRRLSTIRLQVSTTRVLKSS